MFSGPTGSVVSMVLLDVHDQSVKLVSEVADKEPCHFCLPSIPASYKLAFLYTESVNANRYPQGSSPCHRSPCPRSRAGGTTKPRKRKSSSASVRKQKIDCSMAGSNRRHQTRLVKVLGLHHNQLDQSSYTFARIL